MRIAIGILLVLAGIAVIVMTRQSDISDDQAGRAYVETETGDLVLATGEREAERTVVPDRKSEDGSDEEWLTKFVLTERSGEQMGSEDLKGQPYVAGFFFSTCPSICVQQNTKVKRLQEKFKDQPIRFLSISCDPEVDSPDVLSEYATKFDADEQQWLFFTGQMGYIRRVGAEMFSLGVVRRGHPEKFALVDAQGEVYGLYTWSDDAQWEALVRDIEAMLTAGGVLPKQSMDESSAASQNESPAESSEGNAT